MSTSSESTRKPVSTGSVKDRFFKLAANLQFAWFAGHSLVLLCAFFYLFGFRQIFYRLAYVGVLHSFGIITYQQYYLNSQTSPSNDSSASSLSKLSIYTLLNDENVLYFALSLMWFITPVFTLSLIPYLLFSLFHVLRYLQNNLLPTVFGLTKENNNLVKLIDNFTQTYNEKGMYWVGTAEIFTLVVLLFRALLWYQSSWIILLTYSLFIKMRYENSKYTKAAFAQWRVRLDGIISHPSIPPVVKGAYNTIKTKLIELSRYQLTKPAPHGQQDKKTH